MTEKLHVLGTGNALVTRCYNTCFYLEWPEGGLLVDCGGGNGILRQMEDAGLRVEGVHHLFLTHAHTDHLLGAVWLVRMAATAMRKGSYEGTLTIHCHPTLEQALRTFCTITLQKKFTDFFDERILFLPIKDGESRDIAGRTFTFFDIHSTKMQQFAFTARMDCGKLAFMGDEPVNPACEEHARNAAWLLCEAFCLRADAERFRPYEKHHSTVADGAALAARLGVKNLVLWHTEDKSGLADRKARYTAEAAQHFQGGIYVPDDLDVVEL